MLLDETCSNVSAASPGIFYVTYMLKVMLTFSGTSSHDPSPPHFSPIPMVGHSLVDIYSDIAPWIDATKDPSNYII